MNASIRYDATAAHKLLKTSHLDEIEPDILAARDELFQDVELLKSGGKISAEKRPLDAGFIELPNDLLTEQLGADKSGSGSSLLDGITDAASLFRAELDRVVVLGIGGSYMGARALFEGLCNPFHNELSEEERAGAPRLYFEGNNADNDSERALLELLKSQCRNKADRADRWGIVVISKSGGTLETAIAFRLFREALDNYYGSDSDESRRYVVPVTGEQGKLRNLSNARGYPRVFPIPDNVGGRFSIFTAVGLLPAAVLGLDVNRLLQGAADMTERFRTEPLGNNPVLDYTATCQLLEEELGKRTRVLSTWGSRLEAVGLWYDQLLAESLGKEERGPTPITVVNTRDLHSRGQQHQEGTLDKLITNVIVERPSSPPLQIPTADDDHDQLNKLADKTVPDILSAAIQGTNRAYAEVGRPTADIILPAIDEYSLGQLLQMFMLATVLEGRLIGINPYGQPGVEAYKRNMNEVLQQG